MSAVRSRRRLIATGSRHWRDARNIETGLWWVGRMLGVGSGQTEITVVVGGQVSRETREEDGATVLYGADYLVAKAARNFGWRVEEHHADWNGRAAGPIRNQEMVDLGADAGIAFVLNGVKCAGTVDCATKMVRRNIPVLYWPAELEK